MIWRGPTGICERLSVILDEIDVDFKKAAMIAKAAGLKAIELRMAFGRNIIDLSDSQLLKIKKHLKSLGLQISALATPLFKCFIPGEERKGKIGDQFGFQANDYLTHKALIGRILEIADIFEVKAVRCFSFWNSGPLNETKLQQIAELLAPAVEAVSRARKMLILENENSCYIKTAQDASRLLSLLKTPSVRFLWDPGNGKLEGEDEEIAFTYAKRWVQHVHIKDFIFQNGKINFVIPGKGVVRYQTILAGLQQISYEGFLSFEPCLGTLDKATFIKIVNEFFELCRSSI